MRILSACALSMFLVAACGDSGSSGDDDGGGTPDAGPSPLLDPPPPGQGYQFRMSTEIPPGVEGEWCKFVEGPAEEYYINHDQVRFAAGSHHFLLYQTAYTTIPTQKEDGTPVDTSKVFDCSEGATAGWDIVKLLGGSQNGDGESIVGFPPDVGMRVPANTVLLMNAHYINVSDSPITPEVAINLWTVPKAQVTQEGDILFLYNPFIKVPANGTGRARWRCPVHQDITIGNIQSHMHKRGVGFAAMIDDGAPFYENTAWEDVPVKVFQPGMQVAAGSHFDYYCDYDNPGPQDVFQGARTTDEMCMLIGVYWPANPSTSNCRDANGDMAGEWIGNGTATCAATWTCIEGAVMGGGDVIAGVSGCIHDASPTISKELSAAVNCVAANQAFAPCQTPIDACKAL